MKPIRAAAGSVVRKVVRLWPLSLFGSLNFAGAAAVWAISAARGNHAGMMLSLFVFIVLLLAVLATRLHGGSSHPEDYEWSLNATLREGANPAALRIRASAAPGRFSFARVHLRLSGPLSSAGANLYRVVFEHWIPAGPGYDAELDLPASGMISLRGGYVVRDALGLSRKPFGVPQRLDAAVLPSCGGDFDIRVTETSASAERNALKKQSEEEKYFIREYVPGDLARDINWKALARTGVILTRIPPEAPKEGFLVRLVIHIPPAGRTRVSRARALLQLDHIRSLAATFMHTVRATSGNYGFSVGMNGMEYVVRPGESLEGIRTVLAETGFSPGVPPTPAMNIAAVASAGIGAGSSAADLPEKAWIIGSASDPVLGSLAGKYLDSGSSLLLSRPEGLVRFRAAHSLPLVSAIPQALPYAALFFALRPAEAKGKPRENTSGVFPSASPSVFYFDCGVRP